MTAVAKWFDGQAAQPDGDSNWTFDGDVIHITPTTSIISMWEEYARNKILPYPGGWARQPLRVLVQIHAVDLVVNTYRVKNAPDADWSQFSPTQIHIIREMEKSFV